MYTFQQASPTASRPIYSSSMQLLIQLHAVDADDAVALGALHAKARRVFEFGKLVRERVSRRRVARCRVLYPSACATFRATARNLSPMFPAPPVRFVTYVPGLNPDFS